MLRGQGSSSVDGSGQCPAISTQFSRYKERRVEENVAYIIIEISLTQSGPEVRLHAHVGLLATRIVSVSYRRRADEHIRTSRQ